ncbi:hypothetical protein KI387_026645 [Taxus chinensis]|uniref:Uncharacterized protein n=1 Tax=Taxus chinensis TaxID=29808 RepID=A0AA38FX56_TAXCH|nr:hypothetical protein KI387_026645 [Taxus chinensis]
MSGAPPPSPSQLGLHSGNGHDNDDDELANYLDKLGRSLSNVKLLLPASTCNNTIAPDPDRDLPVIDLSGERELVVRKISAAAAELGCFQVVNHGVPSHIVERAEEECKRLFRLPFEKKEEIISEGVASPFGFDDEEEETKNSSKQQWFWLPKNAHHIRNLLTHIWPQGCDNFSRALGDYCDALLKLSGEILDILLEGLSSGGNAKWKKEERSHLAAEIESHDASLLCITNYYKGIYKPDDDQVRVRHSFPYILFLQYQTSASYNAQLFIDNTWVSILPHPASLLVIVGDVVKVWSNGKYKNAIARPAEEQKEKGDDCAVMGVMYAPSTDISISPITQVLMDSGDDEKPRYSSIDLKEYASRLRRQWFVFEDPLQRYQN